MKLTNFRDLGGLVAANGQKVRTKKILRSGELVQLDETTKTQLATDYDVTLVIDFRRDFEIQERPDDQIPGVQFVNIDILKSARNNASLEDFITIGASDKVDQHMLNIYHDLVMDPNAQAGYAQFLDLVLNNQTGATLFHCFAGKDRTGFGAALILALLNVSEEQIMQDYLKTNEDRKQANDQIIDYYRQQGAKPEALAALAIALYVKKEYLQNSFHLIKSNYQDVFHYAQTQLNFGPEKVQKLQKQFLE